MKTILSNHPKYDPIAHWCLGDVLQMEEYNVNITVGTLVDGQGLFLRPNNIQLNHRLDESTSIRTLFHELRHYYQHITNMFDFDCSKYSKIKVDENVEYDDYYFIDDIFQAYFRKVHEVYLNLPWEIEARAFAVKTYGQYLAKFGRLQ